MVIGAPLREGPEEFAALVALCDEVSDDELQATPETPSSTPTTPPANILVLVRLNFILSVLGAETIARIEVGRQNRW
jgi:hypothetical protein